MTAACPGIAACSLYRFNSKRNENNTFQYNKRTGKNPTFIRQHLLPEDVRKGGFPLFIKRHPQCLVEQFAQPGLQAVAQFFIAQSEVDVGRQIIHPVPGVKTDAAHLTANIPRSRGQRSLRVGKLNLAAVSGLHPVRIVQKYPSQQHSVPQWRGGNPPCLWLVSPPYP